MSKAGKRILGSVRKARAFARGEDSEGFVVHVPDAVKEWEIGRRKPDRSARVLLKIVEHEPDAVRRALG
jgi:putative transcriptional regulator